jgi:hypothetical protein
MTPGMQAQYEKQKVTFFKWMRVGAVVYALIEATAYLVVLLGGMYLIYVTFDWPAIAHQAIANSVANIGKMRDDLSGAKPPGPAAPAVTGEQVLQGLEDYLAGEQKRIDDEAELLRRAELRKQRKAAAAAHAPERPSPYGSPVFAGASRVGGRAGCSAWCWSPRPS